MSEVLLDRAGRRRSPATMPGFHAGRSPRNKDLRYPADPPKVEEIVAVMCAAGDGPHGQRLRGLIVSLWRAGLRIQEALSLGEADLDQRGGSLLVRHGKGGRRPRSRHGRMGLAATPAVARHTPRVARRTAVLHRQRSHVRTTLGQRRGASRFAPDCCQGRRASTLRAAPAPARPRRRDGPRRRPAGRHPAPART